MSKSPSPRNASDSARHSRLSLARVRMAGLIVGLGDLGVSEPRATVSPIAGLYREPHWFPEKESDRCWNSASSSISQLLAKQAGHAERIDVMHRKRGWDELGYHFVIGNGSDSAGRSGWKSAPAGSSKNTGPTARPTTASTMNTESASASSETSTTTSRRSKQDAEPRPADPIPVRRVSTSLPSAANLHPRRSDRENGVPREGI